MTPEQKSVEVKLTILIVMLALMFITSIFIVTRESAGVRAEAGVRGVEIALQLQAQNELARHNDLAARVRKSNTRKRWIERAIDRGVFPSVSEDEIAQILEILDAQESNRDTAD